MKTLKSQITSCHIWLTPDLKKRVTTLAKKRNVSQSEVVRDILSEYFTA